MQHISIINDVTKCKAKKGFLRIERDVVSSLADKENRTINVTQITLNYFVAQNTSKDSGAMA